MMKKINALLVVGFFAFVCGGIHQTFAQRTLGIPAVYQRTPVWCWAAVGEMALKYYGVANINPGNDFQCGIIALIHPVCNQNCYNCPVPAGSLQTMENMLTRYPSFASNVSNIFTRVSVTSAYSALSMAQVRSQIDGGSPVVAGISPSGYRPAANVSEHVALIIGYSSQNLIVNDPFPFDSVAFSGNPYTAAGGQRLGSGRYSIPYSSFASRLQWGESIYNFRCEGSGCRTSAGGGTPVPTPRPVIYGRSCRTQFGVCGPFLNQPALPVGSSCYCATPTGPHYGTVVQP